jgi:hypothetical protein
MENPVRPESETVQDTRPNPYRGLEVFREQDEKYFFGRDNYTETLINFLDHKPLIAVVGPPGIGKSSLIYAGLIPHLCRQGNWGITCFRPGEHPIHSLSAAVVSLLKSHTSDKKRLLKIEKLAQKFLLRKLNLKDIFEAIFTRNPHARMLLFADQFEDIYILCREETERRRFIDELLTSCANLKYSQFSVIITLRADFLGKALSYRPFADALQNADLKLGPMNRNELREIIEKPPTLLNVKIEDGLTDYILNEINEEAPSLPLLAFALTKLWEKQTHGTLTHFAYNEIGGVENALASYADSVYEGLRPEEQARARNFFKQLIRPREAFETNWYMAASAKLEPDEQEVAKKLAESRLIAIRQNDTTGQIAEFAHECLITGWRRLREWLETDREFQTWRERLKTEIQRWEQNNYKSKYLLKDGPLTEAEDWMKKRRELMKAEEQEFVEAGVNIRKKSQRRRKASIAAAIIAAFMAVILGLLWDSNPFL